MTIINSNKNWTSYCIECGPLTGEEPIDFNEAWNVTDLHLKDNPTHHSSMRPYDQ